MLSVVCISVVGRCQLDITQHVQCVASCLPHIVGVLFLVFILFSLFKCIKGSEYHFIRCLQECWHDKPFMNLLCVWVLFQNASSHSCFRLFCSVCVEHVGCGVHFSGGRTFAGWCTASSMCFGQHCTLLTGRELVLRLPTAGVRLTRKMNCSRTRDRCLR